MDCIVRPLSPVCPKRVAVLPKGAGKGPRHDLELEQSWFLQMCYEGIDK